MNKEQQLLVAIISKLSGQLERDEQVRNQFASIIRLAEFLLGLTIIITPIILFNGNYWFEIFIFQIIVALILRQLASKSYREINETVIQHHQELAEAKAELLLVNKNQEYVE